MLREPEVQNEIQRDWSVLFLTTTLTVFHSEGVAQTQGTVNNCGLMNYSSSSATRSSCSATRPSDPGAGNEGTYNLSKPYTVTCTTSDTYNTYSTNSFTESLNDAGACIWWGDMSQPTLCDPDLSVEVFNATAASGQDTWRLSMRQGEVDPEFLNCTFGSWNVIDSQTCSGSTCQSCSTNCSTCSRDYTYGIPADDCYYYGGCPASPYYRADSNCCGYNSSPIIVDLDGTGFSLTDPANGVLFDLLANGKPVHTAWIAPGTKNAWLALDRNGNGSIDSGAELFGSFTPQPPSKEPNGFLALAVFDLPENGGNGNGIIDPGDAVFSKLRLWIDENHNGISEPSELHTLDEFGIKAIKLDYHESKFTDMYGNDFRYRGGMKVPGKADKTIYDVFLRFQP